MRNSNIAKMAAKIGIITAMGIIMSFPPFGSIRIPIFMVHVTLAHLPTIILAILEGPIYGLISGIFLGIISMIRCIMEPDGLNIFIANPLVSILPRAIVGLLTGLCYNKIRELHKNSPKLRKADFFGIGISAAVGSAANTIGVLGMLYLIYSKPLDALLIESGMSQGVFAFLAGIALAGGVGELIIITILSTILVKAIRRSGYKAG